MPFMVIYSTSDGRSCHEQADAIDEAALVVERLRNQDGIEDTRIYRMEEISFAFRPYYKVELGLPERLVTAPPADILGTAPVSTPPETVEIRVDVAPEPEARLETPVGASTVGAGDAADESGANSRRGLFGR